MPTDSRQQQLQQWINEVKPEQQGTLQPASSDASFRRYFRLQTDSGSLIAMDAPPEKEHSQSFVDIAQLLESEGL
ncbi:MAG: aminoglycoside phosphotransferase, partial [Gammaproteobacteria bacterium]|nr:aminoglycoside phosphotransferase [Gammaproteobacteria bacterium]